MIFPLLCCFPTLTFKRPKGRFVALRFILSTAGPCILYFTIMFCVNLIHSLQFVNFGKEKNGRNQVTCNKKPLAFRAYEPQSVKTGHNDI